MKQICILIFLLLVLSGSAWGITRVPILGQDFSEGIPPDWVRVDNNGDGHVWDVGVPSGGEEPTLSNDYALADANAWLSANDELWTGAIDCTNFTDVVLIYDLNYDSLYDSLSVGLSVDDGDTWATLETFTTDMFVNNHAIDISAMADGKDRVRVRYVYQADWGWYAAIDNVRIMGKPQNHGLWMMADSLSKKAGPGSAVTYNLTLYNNTGSGASVDLQAENNSWEVTIPASVTVPQGGSSLVSPEVIIPTQGLAGIEDTATIKATLGNYTATLKLKTKIGWITVGQTPNPVYQHAVVYGDGFFYVIGGVTSGTPLDSIWKYDPSTHLWHTDLAKIPKPRSNQSACYMNGKIYLPGGFGNHIGRYEDTLYIYDVNDDRWGTAQSPVPSGGTGGPAFSAVVCDEKRERVWVIGGRYFPGPVPTSATIYYDAAGDEWNTESADMPRAVYGLRGVLVNDSIVVLGGDSESDAFLSAVMQYDISTDRWSELEPMNTARIMFAAGYYNGFLIVAGSGINGAGSNSAEFSSLNTSPSGNLWIDLYDPLPEIIGSTDGAVNPNTSMFYVFGGYGPRGASNQVFAFPLAILPLIGVSTTTTSSTTTITTTITTTTVTTTSVTTTTTPPMDDDFNDDSSSDDDTSSDDDSDDDHHQKSADDAGEETSKSCCAG